MIFYFFILYHFILYILYYIFFYYIILCHFILYILYYIFFYILYIIYYIIYILYNILCIILYIYYITLFYSILLYYIIYIIYYNAFKDMNVRACIVHMCVWKKTTSHDQMRHGRRWSSWSRESHRKRCRKLIQWKLLEGNSHHSVHWWFNNI